MGRYLQHRPMKLQLILALSVLLPFALLVLYWAKYIRPAYFPLGDEFALIVHSAKQFYPSASSWFLEGYKNYFIVYPEWTVPYTDFLRPVANISYYLNSLIFGSHWSDYLLLNYAAQSMIVAISVLIAVQRLKLPLKYSMLVGVMCFISPAFGTQELYFPSFAFDLIAAVLVLAGVNWLMQDRLAAAWVCFCIAIFTKETALFAPFIAFLVVFFQSARSNTQFVRWLKSTLFLLPVIAWLWLRHMAFSSAGGVYIFDDFKVSKQLMLGLHGILSWPMGMRSLTEAAIFKYLFFAINSSFWAIVILGLAASLRKQHKEAGDSGFFAGISDRFGVGGTERLIVLAFCIGSLGMPMMLNLGQRFGASFYPLFFLVLACAAYSARSKQVQLIALCAGTVLVALTSLQWATSNPGLADLKPQWD
ncbi:MAG: hypothetical protein ACYCPO_02820 [Acidobacteriaceae bacterium]